jgi:hypothetical protein
MLRQLVILQVVVLLGSRCEDPEAIRKSAKVGTDGRTANVTWVVGIRQPIIALKAIESLQHEATWLARVPGNAKMVVSLLQVDRTSLSDFGNVKPQTVVNEELGVCALNCLLHPRNSHQFILGEILPSRCATADGEGLIVVLTGLKLGSHLVVVLGCVLVGEGARHLGRSLEEIGIAKRSWQQIYGPPKISIFSPHRLASFIVATTTTYFTNFF